MISLNIPKINSDVSLCLAQIKKSIIAVFSRLRLFQTSVVYTERDPHGSALICTAGSADWYSYQSQEQGNWPKFTIYLISSLLKKLLYLRSYVLRLIIYIKYIFYAKIQKFSSTISARYHPQFGYIKSTVD